MAATHEEEIQALAALRGPATVSYDELDRIFTVFGFGSGLAIDEAVWYEHPRYPRCGRFRAKPRYDLSVLTEEQKSIAAAMIDCVRRRRLLEEG